MGAIVMNGNYYAGNAGNTTRFVQDTSDENYGWIQYKDENGDWVNWVQAEKNGVLFSANNNVAEFKATTEYSTQYSNDDCTLSVSDVLTLKSKNTSHTAGYTINMISKKIDVTDFSTIVMTSKVTFPSANDYNQAWLWVATALSKPTAAAAIAKYAQGGTIFEGTAELDISSISGEVYIGVTVMQNTSGTYEYSCVVEEMYME